MSLSTRWVSGATWPSPPCLPSWLWSSEISPVLVNFLMGLKLLQSRTHLLYLIKLCCLCITPPSLCYRSGIVGSVDASNHESRFTDVLLPGQSYLSGVPDSYLYCSSHASMAKFSLLSAAFGRSAFTATWDPWTFVDSFGRSRIYVSHGILKVCCC